ncbi:MAG: hypothetical protein GC168_05985 [Candidatus Hydrogenedens sp.]|nr:hypothetical protein [Candidatus Hydrogenedens sp.]
MANEMELHEIQTSKEFLLRSASAFEEADSGFTPHEGMYTVAAQLAHIALSVDWFVDGATNPNGFAMDFEEHDRAARAVTSLSQALSMIDRSYANAEAWVSQSDLSERLPDGMVMPNAPKGEVVYGIVDHTAHHRGALTVYARALGKVSPMPYMG